MSSASSPEAPKAGKTTAEGKSSRRRGEWVVRPALRWQGEAARYDGIAPLTRRVATVCDLRLGANRGPRRGLKLIRREQLPRDSHDRGRAHEGGNRVRVDRTLPSN